MVQERNEVMATELEKKYLACECGCMFVRRCTVHLPAVNLQEQLAAAQTRIAELEAELREAKSSFTPSGIDKWLEKRNKRD